MNDEEKEVGSTNGGSEVETEADKAEKENAIKSQPKMTDIFSWQKISYTVPIGHCETRKLLDNVSGYVAPGKLTALMGESGAGKVRVFYEYAYMQFD